MLTQIYAAERLLRRRRGPLLKTLPSSPDLRLSARSAATCSGGQAGPMAFGPGFSRGDALGDGRMGMEQQFHQARRMAFTQGLPRELFHGRDVRRNIGNALPAVKIGLRPCK